MFTKSSSTHFLHDSKTLILAINCMKVAKPNVDWWYTIFFLLLVWWNHNISLMVLLTYIGTSNFQHPHAVIPVLIKLNSRLLGKIWLWYRIIGKYKMLCFHKRSGSWYVIPCGLLLSHQETRKRSLIPTNCLLSPFAFLSVSGYTPMEFHIFREL